MFTIWYWKMEFMRMALIPKLRVAVKPLCFMQKDSGWFLRKFFMIWAELIFWHVNDVKLFNDQVEENVGAAIELSTFGKDQQTLAKIEAILSPVKNQTWPSGTQKSWWFGHHISFTILPHPKKKEWVEMEREDRLSLNYYYAHMDLKLNKLYDLFIPLIRRLRTWIWFVFSSRCKTIYI